MLETHEQHSQKKLIATILSIAIIAGCVVFADHIKTKDSSIASAVTPTTSLSTPTVASTSAQTQPVAAPVATAPTTSTYKDGSYTASSSYYVPHGNESIKVNLTLKDGAVSDVSIQNSESDRESAQYQQDFASVIKSYVVGKKISGLKLGVVAGASDTTQGFDDALSQIATKAQA